MTDTIPAWAVKGAKVVCVGYDGPDAGRSTQGEVTPTRGETYTVREIDLEHVAFRLVEIVNAPRHYSDIGFRECAFRIRAFRPLVTRTQDQDIAEHFKPLLDAEPPLVRVPHMGEVS